MKILIVATFFPPQNSIASLRSYSWAKWWSQMGHDVTVLTTKKHPRSSDMPMNTSSFEVIEVSVPILECFLNQKTQQLMLEPELESRSGMGKSAKEHFIKRFLRKIMQSTGIFSACRFPDFHDLWVSKALKKVAHKEWDLVVSTGWPYSTHRVGLSIKKKTPATQWVVDWRDLWTDNHMYPGIPVLTWYEKWLENKFHKYADLITTVSIPLADTLSAKTSTPVEVVYNGFDPEDYQTLPIEKYFKNDGVKRISYTGSIYIGKRDPSPLFKAIEKLTNAKKLHAGQLKVIFAGANVDLVKELAEKYNVLEFCVFAGFLPRQDALRIQRDSDALLLLEFEAPGLDGILTGKLFEYLFAGPPIWGVGVTEKTSAGELIIKAGKGEAFGKNIESIEKSILDLISADSQTIPNNKVNIGIISEFERERQAIKMLGYLNLN